MGKRLSKQVIVERFIPVAEQVEIDQTKLPEGISFRATYPICNIGELNRNRRRYRKEVWEKVDKDSEIQEKLKTRSLFGHAEHPKDTSQSSTEKISHVVTKIFNEGTIQKCTVEGIKGTPYGDIVYAILRAKCGLGMSTRAEGDLEECQEGDEMFYDVIPESYSLKTVDFTADPSTYGAYPESVQLDILDVVKKGIDNEKIDREFAAVLLESLKLDTAKNLRESIVNDKHRNEAVKDDVPAFAKAVADTMKKIFKDKVEDVSKIDGGYELSVKDVQDIEAAHKQADAELGVVVKENPNVRISVTHDAGKNALRVTMAESKQIKFPEGVYEFAHYLHGEKKWVRNGTGHLPAGHGWTEGVTVEGKMVIRAGKDAWLFLEEKKVNEVGEYVPDGASSMQVSKASDTDKQLRTATGNCLNCKAVTTFVEENGKMVCSQCRQVQEDSGMAGMAPGAGGGPAGVPQGVTGSGAGGDKAQALKADAARVSGEAPFREGAGDGKYNKQIKQAYANWNKDFPNVQADADDIFNDVINIIQDSGYTMTKEELEALYKEITGGETDESKKQKNERWQGYDVESILEFFETAEKNPVRFKRVFSKKNRPMTGVVFEHIKSSLAGALKERVKIGEAARKLSKEVQVQMGKDTPILNVVMDVEVSHDPNYGADADGRRGVPTDFIEDVTITSVRDSNGKEISITPEIRKAVDAKLEQMDMAELEENKKGDIVMKRRIQETKEKMNTGINFDEIYAEMQKASEDAFLSSSEKASLTESKTAVDFYKNVAKVISESKRVAAIAKAERDKTLEIVESKIKELEVVSAEVKKVTEAIAKLKEQSTASIKAFGEKLMKDLKGIYEKKMEGIKDTYEKKLKEQKDIHTRDIFQKTVVDVKIKESGLELPENAVALIRQCKTSEEVDTLISKMRFALKESLHHSGRPDHVTVDVGDGGSGLAGVSETEKLIQYLK